MSFKKILTCSRCQLTSSVEDEKFPEDLYALLIKYSLSQILWICKPCYKEDNLTSIESMHHVDDEIKLLNAKFKKMESDISEIKSVIQKLQLVTNDNFATTFKHELKRMEEFNFDKNSPKICSLLGYNQNVNSYKEEISGVDSDSSITSEENQKNLNTLDVIDGCKRTNLHSSSTPKNSRNENIQLFSLSANYQTEDSLSSSFSCSGSLDSNSKILAEANTSQKRNKEAHKIIHEIVNAKIKIDDEESTKSSNIVDVFLKTITPALKKIDPVFNIMYERDYKTGSSYTDLRISEASEYDIDIVLKTPSEIRLEVEFLKLLGLF